MKPNEAWVKSKYSMKLNHIHIHIHIYKQISGTDIPRAGGPPIDKMRRP